MRCESWSNDFFGWIVICVIYGWVPLSIVGNEFIVTRRPIRLAGPIRERTRRWIRILLSRQQRYRDESYRSAPGFNALSGIKGPTGMYW